MNTKYRAQILLEPEQHAILAEVAQRENRSISDLVREIIREWLDNQAMDVMWQKRRQPIEGMRQIRESIQEKYGIYQGNLIEATRNEHDEDVDRVWRGEA